MSLNATSYIHSEFFAESNYFNYYFFLGLKVFLVPILTRKLFNHLTVCFTIAHVINLGLFSRDDLTFATLTRSFVVIMHLSSSLSCSSFDAMLVSTSLHYFM